MYECLHCANIGGEAAACVADVEDFEHRFTPGTIRQQQRTIACAGMVIVDGNLSTSAIAVSTLFSDVAVSIQHALSTCGQGRATREAQSPQGAW